MNATARSLLVWLPLCAMLGSFGFLLFVGPYLFTAAQPSAAAAQGAASTILTYGTINSVDAANRTISFTFADPYATGTPVVYSMVVNPDAYIADQELKKDNDVYDGVTEKLASLSDIHTPARAALVIKRNAQNQLATSYLLFGNPL